MHSVVGFNDPKNIEHCCLIRFNNDATVHIIDFQAFFDVKDEAKLCGAKKSRIGI